jgi:hypothetical protein
VDTHSSCSKVDFTHKSNSLFVYLAPDGDRNRIIFAFTPHEVHLSNDFPCCRDSATVLRNTDIRIELAGTEISRSQYRLGYGLNDQRIIVDSV